VYGAVQESSAAFRTTIYVIPQAQWFCEQSYRNDNFFGNYIRISLGSIGRFLRGFLSGFLWDFVAGIENQRKIDFFRIPEIDSKRILDQSGGPLGA
jgi:hypothetical protein